MTGPQILRRLRGEIRITQRGPLLEADDGYVWRLNATEDLAEHAGRSVQVEAWQRGSSLLDLLWIGPAS